MDAPSDYHSFVTALTDAVNAGGDALEARLAELSARTGTVAASGDTVEIARLRSRVERLRRRVESLTGGANVARAVDTLQSLSTTLGAARTHARLHSVAVEDRQELPVLRERILRAVADSAMRPRDLVERFETDPTQVSRALRELVDRGRIALVTAPGADPEDGRARRYMAIGQDRGEPIAAAAGVAAPLVKKSKPVTEAIAWRRRAKVAWGRTLRYGRKAKRVAESDPELLAETAPLEVTKETRKQQPL